MIHHQRLDEIREEIQEKQFAIVFGDLDDEDVSNYQSDIDLLEEEKAQLKREQEEYREGYYAGRDYHLDGVSMKDEWQGQSDAFDQGFTQAGRDS